jgi:hypothetical protein
VNQPRLPIISKQCAYSGQRGKDGAVVCNRDAVVSASARAPEHCRLCLWPEYGLSERCAGSLPIMGQGAARGSGPMTHESEGHSDAPLGGQVPEGALGTGHEEHVPEVGST